jgi:transcriptional regulator with XRE-family HTH domain
MPKVTFGEILQKARSENGMSLRQLSAKSGIEFTRLSRMEHGTRPAPGLPQLRRLAELLSLNLVDLVVSAGIPREAVEQLLWIERLQLAESVENLSTYTPQGHRAGLKNEFIVDVVSRNGALCTAQLGSEEWTVIAFSNAERLNLRIPPEAIHVFSDDPQGFLISPCNVFRARIVKIRKTGSLLNLVLEIGGVELNVLLATHTSSDTSLSSDDWVYVASSPAALSTEPHKASKGRK